MDTFKTEFPTIWQEFSPVGDASKVNRGALDSALVVHSQATAAEKDETAQRARALNYALRLQAREQFKADKNLYSFVSKLQSLVALDLPKPVAATPALPLAPRSLRPPVRPTT
jgi:hypothetical protein